MKYKSYKDEVIKRMKEAAESSLEATGQEAQRDVILKVTANQQVDTGRMRASVTYVAGKKRGSILPDLKGKLHNEDNPKGSLPEDTLHIGTNVHYAIWQEKKQPFLAPVIKNNLKRYTEMMESIFAQVMQRR